jgi:hypothetical protein
MNKIILNDDNIESLIKIGIYFERCQSPDPNSMEAYYVNKGSQIAMVKKHWEDKLQEAIADALKEFSSAYLEAWLKEIEGSQNGYKMR